MGRNARAVAKASSRKNGSGNAGGMQRKNSFSETERSVPLGKRNRWIRHSTRAKSAKRPVSKPLLGSGIVESVLAEWRPVRRRACGFSERKKPSVCARSHGKKREGIEKESVRKKPFLLHRRALRAHVGHFRQASKTRKSSTTSSPASRFVLGAPTGVWKKQATKATEISKKGGKGAKRVCSNPSFLLDASETVIFPRVVHGST